LDISVKVPSHEEAIKLCIEHDQKGYYNIEEDKYYEVNANATSGGALKGENYVRAKESNSVLRKIRPEESTSFGRRNESTDYEINCRKQREASTSKTETVSLIKAAKKLITYLIKLMRY
jgi:hypothetical protein